jgi:hypothetical protein
MTEQRLPLHPYGELLPKRGSDLPVTENSRLREKHERNQTSAQKTPDLVKVSEFSVQAAGRVRKQGVEALSPPWMPADDHRMAILG